MPKKKTQEQFINNAKAVHGDKYDYSKVEYINSQTKVCIICPEHGEFWQMPYSHLQGHSCPKCSMKLFAQQQRMTTEQFIEKAKAVHGDKYDYSKVEYINSQTKVCIICPEHGEFLQKANVHLNGRGCSKCRYDLIAKKHRMTTEQFIEKAKAVHGDKYDYSKVEYINNSTKVCIICPIHGEFWQTPTAHLLKCNCPKCSSIKQSNEQKLTTEQFIEKAKAVHGDKYDYSKVEYINNSTKVCIICPIHGEFLQIPNSHLLKRGCPKCAGFNMTTEEFIIESNKIHNNKYDYSNTDFINKKRKVCIICHEKDEFGNEHGEFWQLPYTHLKGHGCSKCSKRYKLTTEEFIKKAIKVHGDKYDYSKVEYVNNQTKVCIICPEHGEFWQMPHDHLDKHGCPYCNNSILENTLRLFLQENNIKFEEQKKFPDLKRQPFDFYLPQYNTVIECQGEQHFHPIKHFGGEKRFLNLQVRDKKKIDLCKQHKIRLLYYTNLKEYNTFLNEKIYKSKEELLHNILSH